MKNKPKVVNFKELVEIKLKPFREARARRQKIIFLLFCVWLIVFGVLVILLIGR